MMSENFHPAWITAIFWAAVITWVVVHKYREIRGRRMLPQLREAMTRRFIVTGKPIALQKIVLLQENGSGLLGFHPEYWKLPAHLRATTFAETDAVLMIEESTVAASRRYTERSWFMPKDEDISIRQVRWDVTLFDLKTSRKFDLGVAMGEPPKVVEKSLDSSSIEWHVGETPLQQVLGELRHAKFIKT